MTTDTTSHQAEGQRGAPAMHLIALDAAVRAQVQLVAGVRLAAGPLLVHRRQVGGVPPTALPSLLLLVLLLRLPPRGGAPVLKPLQGARVRNPEVVGIVAGRRSAAAVAARGGDAARRPAAAGLLGAAARGVGGAHELRAGG